MRARQKRLTQEHFNRERGIAHLSGLLEQFSPDSLFLTLGYYPDRQPSSRAAADCLAKEDFIRRVQGIRRAKGVPCAYVLACRMQQGETPAEHRVILSAGGEDDALLRSLWRRGPVLIQHLGEMGHRGKLARWLYLDALESTERNRRVVTHSDRLGPHCNRRSYPPIAQLRALERE